MFPVVFIAVALLSTLAVNPTAACDFGHPALPSATIMAGVVAVANVPFVEPSPVDSVPLVVTSTNPFV
ncbi:unnamed protein product [Colias eurytheme]|nr:unnamed protein product [Colias eurytheme]